MCLAFLAFSQNLKEVFNLSPGVKYSHVLLNPVAMFVACLSIQDIPPFTVQLLRLSQSRFKRGFVVSC